jgi:uncharacterized cupin superfamily protein
LSENSLSWHATFPSDTFVPPHVHPTQDEFVYMLEGRLDFWLDGSEARPNDGSSRGRGTIGLPQMKKN